MWFLLLKDYLVYGLLLHRGSDKKKGLFVVAAGLQADTKVRFAHASTKTLQLVLAVGEPRLCECCKTNQGTCASCFRAMLSEPAFLHRIKLAAFMLLSEAMSIFDWSPASAFYFLEGATLLILFHPGAGSNPLPQYIRVHHTFFLTIPIMMQKRFQNFGGGNFLQILLGPPESNEAYLGTSNCWSSLEGI